MLARWAMLLVAAGLPYLRESGSGSALLRGPISGRRAGVAAFFSVAAIVLVFPLAAPRSIALAGTIALVFVFAMRLFYRRWLGGVTGDLIGACGELVEIAVLVAMAA